MTTDDITRGLDQAEHRIIQQARRHAEDVRTRPLATIDGHYAALEAAEEALTALAHFTRPIEGVSRDQLADAVRIATREHYLPELQWALPGSHREAADRWRDALAAVGVDTERVRRLQAITHAEAVAVCEHLGIEPPAAPVDIDARRRESDEPLGENEFPW